MPNTTSNYALYKPLVNDATDEDLWGGYLNDSMDLIDAQMKVNADAIVNSQLPVGSYYMNETVATNPATLLGYGTWSAITDKFIVAHGSTYTSTGGAATKTLTEANLPSSVGVTLNGNITAWNQGTNPPSGTVGTTIGGQGTGSPGGSSNVTTLSYTMSLGSNSPFSIIPPYQAAYIWKRTA